MSINNIKVSAEGKTIDELIVSVEEGRESQNKGTLPLVNRPTAVELIREENQIALKVSEMSTKHAPLSGGVLRGFSESRAREPAKQLHDIRETKAAVSGESKGLAVLESLPPKTSIRNEFKSKAPMIEMVAAVTFQDRSIQSSFVEEFVSEENLKIESHK
jgi:hypothetical protein